jgi:glycosyltransferase involved in cell wall biosynthesis
VARILVNLLQYTGKKGGMETYVRELYRALGRATSGHEFVGYGSREIGGLDTSWFPGEIEISRISGENRVTWALGELFAVSRAATRLRADLIHGPAMFGPLRPRVPVVISVHDLLYFSHPEYMSTPLYTEPVKWMEKRGAARASRIITISRVSAKAIERYLGFPAERVDLVPLAGTLAASAPPDLPRADALFLAVGQRRPHKNFESLLRGLATLEEVERPRLVITGSYDDDPLAPLVAKLGLERWVELKRWVDRDELEHLMGTTTALVDASVMTGFSLPTLEAMMQGTPVLLADTEIFREVGGDAAAYFDARDPVAIGRALADLAADPERRDRMSVAGRAWAGQFTWDRVASQTLESFEKALAERR